MKLSTIADGVTNWLEVLIALRRRDFLRVLFLTKKSIHKYRSEIIYSWYSLGCYSRSLAVASGYEPKMARDFTAILASHAALGQFEECEKMFCSGVLVLRKDKRYALEVAHGLAKYRPDLALRILEGLKDTLDFRSALHFAIGDADVAADMLQKNKKPTTSDINNGHYFIMANFHRDLSRKYAAINDQLSWYFLDSLTTINPHVSLSVLNLSERKTPHIIEGPLVSIIVPAYNCEKYLSSSVNSLLRQSYKNIEVIIVNDGSQDCTEKIAIGLLKQDNRVKFISTKKNSEAYIARNMGLMNSSGLLVTVNDADDYAHPQKIERQVRPILDDPAIIFTISDLIRVSIDGIIGQREIYPLQRLNTSSLTFRREIVSQDCGLWEESRFGADSEFLFRLKQFYGRGRWRRIRQPLTFASDHSGSLTKSISTGGRNQGYDPRRVAYTDQYILRYLEALVHGGKPAP